MNIEILQYYYIEFAREIVDCISRMFESTG